MRIFLTRIILTLYFLLWIPNLQGNVVDWVMMHHENRKTKQIKTFITAVDVDRSGDVHLIMVSCKQVSLSTSIQSPFGAEAIYLRFDYAQPYSATAKEGNIVVNLIPEVVPMLQHYKILYMDYENVHGKRKKASFDLTKFDEAYQSLGCEYI